MKIAELLEAAMEWTVTIEGRDELGEVRRAQLRIEKGFERLKSGEIGPSIYDGKRIMACYDFRRLRRPISQNSGQAHDRR